MFWNIFNARKKMKAIFQWHCISVWSLIQNSIKIWYINLRKSLEIQTSLISLDVSLNVLGEQGII